MRKNCSRQFSLIKYRLIDSGIFLLILVVSELLEHFALRWFPSGALFTFSLMIPITLLVMVRWGWQSVFYAAISGTLYCLLNGGSGTQYATYIIGNLFILLMLVPLKLIGYKKIFSSAWKAALFAVAAWVCVYLGRSTVFAVAFAFSPVEGAEAYSGFTAFAVSDIISLLMAVVLAVVLRKADGMFEDQKDYLIRLDNERKEKMRRDNYGDEYIEIDEESLSILNKHDDDLY